MDLREALMNTLRIALTQYEDKVRVTKIADLLLSHVIEPALAEEQERWRGLLATQCGLTLAMRERCAQACAKLSSDMSVDGDVEEAVGAYKAAQAIRALPPSEGDR